MNDLKKAVNRLERAYVAGLDEEFRDDVRVVLDALSAQPDAGGGGDVRAQFEEWLAPSWSQEGQADADGDFVYHEDWVQGAWIGWQAAIAARQPVGVEPVEYQVRGPRSTKWETCDRELHESAHKVDGVETRALYTAPPAAVPVDSWDALALRELIDEYWSLAYAEGKEGRTHDTEAGDAQRVSVGIDYAIRHLAAPPAAAPADWGDPIYGVAGGDA